MLATKLKNPLPILQCPARPYNLAEKRKYKALLLPRILGSIKIRKLMQMPIE